MYNIEVHNTIYLIINVFYGVGIWHRSEEIPFRITKTQWFYLLFYSLYPLSLIAGAITNDSKDDAIFSVQVSIICIVCVARFYYLVSKQKQIIKIIHQFGVYSIRIFDDFTVTNGKLNRFMKFVKVFLCYMNFGNVAATLIVPILATEKKLTPNVAFPLDWRNNTIAYIIAKAYISIQILLTTVGIVFSILIWYLLFNCALQYEELGNKLKNLGVVHPDIRNVKIQRAFCASQYEELAFKLENVSRHVSKPKSSPKTQSIFQLKNNLFLEDLIVAIKSHQHLNKLTDNLRSFISYTVLMHVITSSLSICGSIYCLSFLDNDGMEYLVHLVILFYTIFDIFMIMYFGNEIKVSSDRLSYCLFQSNWIDQTYLCQKYLIIFAEFLKQPKELVIGKIYRLTLQTFTTILNSAYYTFNILKTLR